MWTCMQEKFWKRSTSCLLPLPTSSMGGKSHKHGGRFKHKHHLVRFTNPLPEATKHHHGHHWSATASVSARIFVFFCIFDPRTQFSVVLPLDVCGASYFQASVYIRQRYSSFEWFWLVCFFGFLCRAQSCIVLLLTQADLSCSFNIQPSFSNQPRRELTNFLASSCWDL